MSGRLPPYGRLLAQRLARPETWPSYSGTSADGQHLTLWVACGAHAWRWAQPRIARQCLVVLPPGEDPAGYRWELLQGHPPVLIARCGALESAVLDRLAVALLRDGVERVLVLGQGLRYLPGRREHDNQRHDHHRGRAGRSSGDTRRQPGVSP